MGETCIVRNPRLRVEHIVKDGVVEHLVLNSQCVREKPHRYHRDYFDERWLTLADPPPSQNTGKAT